MKKRKAGLTLTEREKLIEETLNSLDNMQSVTVPEDLKNRILKNAFIKKGKIVSLKPIVRFTAAASIVLLISVNLLSILHYNEATIAKRSDVNAMYNEYFSYFHNF